MKAIIIAGIVGALCYSPSLSLAMQTDQEIERTQAESKLRDLRLAKKIVEDHIDVLESRLGKVDVKTMTPIVPHKQAKRERILDSNPIALGGYCSVTLKDDRRWIRGRASSSVKYKGQFYLFTSESNRKRFLKSPQEFAPVHRGRDVVLDCNQGKHVEGQLRTGVTYDGRVYLFKSLESLEEFTQYPEKYSSWLFERELAEEIEEERSRTEEPETIEQMESGSKQAPRVAEAGDRTTRARRRRIRRIRR